MAAQRSNFALKPFRIVVKSWCIAVTTCQMDDTLHCYRQSILRIQTVFYTGFYENWHPSLHIVWMFSCFGLMCHLTRMCQKREYRSSTSWRAERGTAIVIDAKSSARAVYSRISEAVILESENVIAKWSENTIHHLCIPVINFEKP